jgi:hypothetical protein
MEHLAHICSATLAQTNRSEWKPVVATCEPYARVIGTITGHFLPPKLLKEACPEVLPPPAACPRHDCRSYGDQLAGVGLGGRSACLANAKQVAVEQMAHALKQRSSPLTAIEQTMGYERPKKGATKLAITANSPYIHHGGLL